MRWWPYLSNDEACAFAAEALQLEHEAYRLRGQGKGKGHGGFSQNRHFDISGHFNLHERKARLAQLKSKTECRRCGQRGHWSGDAVCPRGARRGGGKKGGSKSPKSSGSHNSGGKSAKPRVVYFSMSDDSPQGPKDGHAYMVVKDEERGGRCIPPPTLVGQSAQPPSPASPTTSRPVPTSLNLSSASGFAPTSLQVPSASGLAPTSLTPSASGFATTSLSAPIWHRAQHLHL